MKTERWISFVFFAICAGLMGEMVFLLPDRSLFWTFLGRLAGIILLLGFVYLALDSVFKATHREDK